MIVRVATRKDIAAWSSMRTQLWPDTTDAHLGEIAAYFDGDSIDIEQVLVLQVNQNDTSIAGFIELNIRNFAEGSRKSRVPYIEAWYVDSSHRNRGHGKQLIAAAEHWAKERGFTELASDTNIDNHHSIALHKKWGFEETERVVCFLKTLD